MKIGAMVPQGWRMDLNGIKPEKQWDKILEASRKIEKLTFTDIKKVKTVTVTIENKYNRIDGLP